VNVVGTLYVINRTSTVRIVYMYYRYRIVQGTNSQLHKQSRTSVYVALVDNLHAHYIKHICISRPKGTIQMCYCCYYRDMRWWWIVCVISRMM